MVTKQVSGTGWSCFLMNKTAIIVGLTDGQFPKQVETTKNLQA